MFLYLFSRTNLQASLGDTDISDRLKALGVLKASSTPSAKTHWLRKVLSRNVDFVKDYPLQALLHDVTMARTITSVVAVAEKQKISPDEAAADMPQFEQYWRHQAQKLEDVCRQAGRFPNLFFTIAPAEWRFPLHAGMFSKEDQEDLSQCQAWLTMHMHNCIAAVLDAVLWKNKAQADELGIAEIEHYTYQFEFQGRGTIHVHAVAWVKYNPGVCVEELSGRSGARGQTSPLVRVLEEIFDCGAVDVQCGQSEHNLLRYVAGYVAKASDSLRFQKGDEARGAPAETSRWRQVYRLLCKRSPLEQELAMYFAGLPMVETSFTGERMYPPIPGSTAINKYRHAYRAYQERLSAAHQEHCQVLKLAEDGRVLRLRNFVEWCRLFRLRQHIKTGEDSWTYVVRERNARGRGTGKKCAIAMTWPFELLDIYCGAYAAAFLPRLEAELCLPADEVVPENMQHLAMLLRLRNGDVDAVLEPMVKELRWRGLGEDCQATVVARVRAGARLLEAVAAGRTRPEDWSARSARAPPRRIWSPEQQRVLDAISAGVQPPDAAEADPRPRLLRVTGGPGAGKTEVLLAAAEAAAQAGCRVLLGGPIGLLVAGHRSRIRPGLDITVETIHSAFKVGRDRDAAYIPPGRLRNYDLIIFDEVSQIDAAVWQRLQVALGELFPCPFVVFVGDFQQLQPVSGRQQLGEDLERQVQAGFLQRIELLPHANARSTDRAMLDFLRHARCQQPSRETLGAFFADRFLPATSDLHAAAREVLRLEAATRKHCTVLAVTNKGAAQFNQARLALEFPEVAQALAAGRGILSDPAYGEQNFIAVEGARVRLTQNLDKERGFVNGATGVITQVLEPDVFVVTTSEGVLILVHRVQQQRLKFLPVTYAYATTMRRAQGATMDLIALWFDRKRPDPGYAYVGASRARARTDVYHLGHLRRSDWRPVGGGDQVHPGPLSESSSASDHDDQEEDDTDSGSAYMDVDEASSVASGSGPDEDASESYPSIDVDEEYSSGPESGQPETSASPETVESPSI